MAFRLPSSSAPRVSRVPDALLLLTLSALTLGACGGSGGDGVDVTDVGAPDTAAGGDLIIGTPGGRDPSGIDTDELRRKAAGDAARGIGINLDKLARFGIADDDDGGPTQASSGDPLAGEMDSALLGDLESASETLSRRLLGVDDPGARVVREGNVITVDPDDASLCADDDTGLLGSSPDAPGDVAGVADGLSDCRRLVADLTVRLDARSEDSGVITYLFAEAPVIALGYSPGGASSEIYLQGVQRVLERIETIERDAAVGDVTETSAMPTLRGALRLDARILDEREESAEIELRVTEALEIGADDTDAGLSLGPSRVFLLGVDEATGEARLSVAWGALRLVAESGDSDGNGELTTIDLGGLTLDLSATADAPTLSLANVGIGGVDVPLTIRVGSTDALTLALETFGVTIDAESGALTFDTDAGVELMLDNLGDLIAERSAAYTARFSANVPVGTRLEERGGGETSALGVSAGGPVTASLIETDERDSRQSEVSVGVGSCFGEDATDDDLGGVGGSTDADGSGDGPFEGLALSAVECP